MSELTPELLRERLRADPMKCPICQVRKSAAFVQPGAPAHLAEEFVDEDGDLQPEFMDEWLKKLRRRTRRCCCSPCCREQGGSTRGEGASTCTICPWGQKERV